MNDIEIETPRTDRAAYYMGRTGDDKDMYRWCDLLNESRAIERDLYQIQNQMFNTEILSLAIICDTDAEKFRNESTQVILRDPETEARVVCYRHLDGRILVDKIHLAEKI